MTEVATNGATEPVVPAIAADGADGQPHGDAHEQRIQSDPAYALEQYKKVKGESTKLYQQTKKYEAITKIADQVGGAENAAKLLNEFAALNQSADVVRIRDHLRTHGTLPTTSTARTDDTPDDEYKDPQTLEIEALRRGLDEVRNSISQTKGVVGKQNVTAMLTKLRTDYPDGFEEHILPQLETTFAEWERTPNGREVLATINYDQLKTVAAKAIAENLDAISEKRYARTLEQKKKASTGGVTSTLSTGREAAVASGARNALEVLAEFRREHGENYS